MSRPKLFYFSDSSYAGGAEEYLRLLAEGLATDEVGLVAVDHPGIDRWIAGWESRGHLVYRLKPGGTLSIASQLFSFARRVRPDVVHLNFPGPYAGALGLAPLVLRLARVPRIVVTEHLPTVGRVGRRYWSKRMGVGSVHAALCVCRAHVKTMTVTFGYPAERVFAVVNGIEAPATPRRRESIPRPLLASARPRFLQVGSLDPRKGALALVQAFDRARRSTGFQGSLHLAGDGPLRPELERLVLELDLGESVQLLGHCPEIFTVLSEVDVAVLASSREGLPLSLLEAMACGLPLIATSVDGNPEVVEDRANGILVPPGDVETLAQALVELGRDVDRRRSFGARSKERFRLEFTVSRMRRETYLHYANAVTLPTERPDG
jgi:glycosyltransferase involved in cell wall biosynthesis